MIDLANFHFIRPWCLLLIPISVLAWWLLRVAQEPLRDWRSIMEPDLLEAMTVNRDKRHKWRGISRLSFWVIAGVAVAGPTWRPEPSPFADDPIPVMLLLKSGDSMNQNDLSPSRMERARLKIFDLAQERKGRPMGLIAYAGSPHLVLPPTRDSSVVATMASEIGPEIMPKPGDDLYAALNLADRTLGQAGGTIVVVADTIALSSRGQLSEFRANHKTPIHILAIARPKTPEEEDLRSAASSLNASITMLTPDNQDVLNLVGRIARTPVAVAMEGEGTRWAEAGWWLVPILAVIMLASFRREQPPQELPE